MAIIRRFEDLEIWQMARQQVIVISQLKLDLRFDPGRQIQRSASSVMDNIAEGFARGGRKEFKNFLIIAKGSNSEVRSQLYRSADLSLITEQTAGELLKTNDLLGKKISTLISYLKTSDRKGPNY